MTPKTPGAASGSGGKGKGRSPGASPASSLFSVPTPDSARVARQLRSLVNHSVSSRAAEDPDPDRTAAVWLMRLTNSEERAFLRDFLSVNPEQSFGEAMEALRDENLLAQLDVPMEQQTERWAGRQVSRPLMGPLRDVIHLLDLPEGATTIPHFDRANSGVLFGGLPFH